jgi:hypothetical protein
MHCQSYHGECVCSLGGATVLVGDGTNSSTRLPTARCAWVFAVQSYHARHLMLSPFVGPVLPDFPCAESP